ncbi:rhomboid-like protein [Nocardia sp. NPDC052566]|uniref:rhomboid-like protein n=1 Tax=Nocardia sp. NPDC052566 TaxID=3364330 RepID=UPI0037C93BB6
MVARSLLSAQPWDERDTKAQTVIRRLPVTLGYLTVLTLSAAAFTVLSDSAESRVVMHASTNLHNLLRGHVGTLFSSAFVIGDIAAAFLIIPLFACLLAFAELRFGSRRLLRIFLAGHIGATLLVAAGLWVAVTADWLPDSIAWAEDVGVSYGAMAVVGALTVALPQRWQTVWATTWLLLATEGVVVGQTFTNVGHLLALAIGLAVAYGLLRPSTGEREPKAPRNRPRPGPITPAQRLTRLESGLLAASVILAAGLLLG